MTTRSRQAAALFAAAVVVASTALAGCSSDRSAQGPGGSRSAVLRVWAGNTTPINRNFNPFDVDTANYPTFGAIYEPLFFFNQLSADPPTGLLGESYAYSDGGKVLTVKIKPGLTWNDGQPLTADDVAFTFGYGPNKSEQFVSAQAPDPTTAVLTYKRPQYTEASLLLGSTWIVPRHIWSKIKDYAAQTNDNPVGSGPYELSSFSDAAYTVKANPDFRDGPPAVAEVQYVGLDSNQSGQDLLATGQLDWVGQFVADPGAVTASGKIATANYQQDPTVITTCADASRGCKGAQTDPAVRQALNLALDRATIAAKAFSRLAAPANPAFVLLPRDQQWLADPTAATSPQTPDAVAAAQVLTAAGYTKDSDGMFAKNGTPINIELISPDGWTDYNDAAKLISEQAAAAGIRVTARTVSEAEYWTPLANGDFQAALYGLTQSLVADPYANYDQYFSTRATADVGSSPSAGQNYSRYSNATVDQAVDQAARTQDVAAKRTAYGAVQRQISTDLPYIPVVVNASQAFYNTQKFTGWPTADDPYADPLPYLSVASAVVLTHLKPAE